MSTLPQPAGPGSLRRPDGQPVRILVVDDEATLTELLSMALRLEGWEVHTAGDGFSAIRTGRNVQPDAVEDRIAGLTAGGDDYVTKPFSLEEVVARLRGLLRRTNVLARGESTTLAVGDLTLDEDSHEVRRGGRVIALTATEYELLRFLMRNPRRVLSKAQILDRVWNYDFGGQANVVELYISYLRKKIDAGRSPMIHTLRGAGYVLKPAE